ncbi:MAG: signal transduction histidine kinase [Myxococcota bacterium]
MRPAERIRRLRRQLSIAYGSVWALSVAVLVGLILAISYQSLQADQDGRILTHAVAVYGLAWLDGETFHRELLDKEVWLLEEGMDVRVLHADGRILYETPILALRGLEARVDAAMATEEPVFASGRDADRTTYRMVGLQAYDEQDQAYGAILVSMPSGPSASRWRRLAAGLLSAAALMVVAGLWLGGRLAERGIAPLIASMRERELLLAAAAHELRTPLASLTAIVESARAGDEPAEVALPRLHQVLSVATERVGRLMAWARLGTADGERTPLRLDLLVEQVIDDDPIVLEAEACVVDGDAAALAIAIRNLIENAQRHGRPPIMVTVAEGRVVVSDAGDGFAAIEAAARPFSARPDSPGSGLGLDIIRRVAEAHGGTMRLENRPGGGAQVTLEVPVRR